MSEKKYLTYISSPKVTVALLVVLSFTAVFYGLSSWKKSFKYGLLYNDANKIETQKTLAQTNGLENAASDTTLDFTDPSLKVKDTDNDGLNDWDELNTYKTSPYIADSDSDNISDGDEVKRNSDPLCAEGTNCLAYEVAPISKDDSMADIAEVPTTTIDFEALKDISSGDLRKLLLNAGYTEEQLKQLTDDQLNQLWQQALQDLSNKTKN